MEIQFVPRNLELLKTPYYADFFYENIIIYFNEENTTDAVFESAVHGTFLLKLGEALINLVKTKETQKVESIGTTISYRISQMDHTIYIVKYSGDEEIEKHLCRYNLFFEGLTLATKNYLHTIKRENPRIVLIDQYQLLASCFINFDQIRLLELQ